MVEGGREGLSGEDGLDASSDGRDTCASTNKFDSVDLLESQTGVGKRLLDGSFDTLENGGDELFVLFTGESARSINIVHDGFDVEGSFSVSRKNFLDLVATGLETESSLGARKDVNLVLGLELFGEVLNKSVVNVTATDVGLVGSCLDVQLSLGESDNGNGHGRVTNIDENDVTGVLSLRKIRFGDTPSEGNSGSVIDEAEDVKVGDLSGIEESSSLDVSVPSGDGDNDIADTVFELVSGNVSKLAKVSTDELGSGEGFLFAEVCNLENRKICE